MKQIILFIAFMAFAVNAQQITSDGQNLQKNDNKYFIENQGQWPDEVRYLTKLNGLNAWITDFGVVYDYYSIKKNYTEAEVEQVEEFYRNDFKDENTSVEGHVLRMAYESANLQAQDFPSGKQSFYHNYFIGNDQSKWQSRVALYDEVIVEDMYEGIDIRYYYDDGLIRYDYKIEAGADVSQIAFDLEGADSYSVNRGGELVIETSLGSVYHGKLLAYQNTWYGAKTVEVGFTTIDGKVGIDAAAYDRAKELIIDPLVYSTYIGTSSADNLRAIAASGTGSVVTGQSQGTDYPTTLGAYSTSNTGLSDIIVTKFNADLSALEFSTYIGGISVERTYAITTDASDNIYITGYTTSGDFPTTSGAFQEFFNNSTDGYVIKLSSDGTSLVYSTYMGGTDIQQLEAIFVDGSGNAYVAGETDGGWPLVGTPYDNTLEYIDGIIGVLSADGSTLLASTYLGTSSDEWLLDIYFDGTNICVVGFTYSSDFPTTTGAFDETFNNKDGIFVKLSSDLSTLNYSTFLGGSTSEEINSMAVDGSGNFYFSGRTNSTDFPVTSGAYDETNNSSNDIFIVKFNSSVTTLDFATYLGGSSGDELKKIILDGSNNVVVLGITTSVDFPVVEGSYALTTSGSIEIVISLLNNTGSQLLYSSYLGGSSNDHGYDLYLKDDTTALICGETYSSDFPVTTGAYDETYNGDYDGIVTELTLILEPSVELTSPNGGESWEAGTPKAITWNSIVVSNVKLEYTVDDGIHWHTIVNSIDASIGSFNWTVPDSASSQCRVRVSDASDATVNDVSDAIFTIFLPSVTVTTPNGGETFVAGNSETITWTAEGVDNVKIEYSLDNGSNWTVIDPSVAGSLGTYDWNVPNVSSTTALIRLSDDLDPSIVDVSDLVFTIGTPSATINYVSGWNVLSVPFALNDNDPATVFPTKTSEVFAYSSGYYAIFGLQPTQGFWVQFGSSGSETVNGQGVSDNTVDVYTGWNIIGTPDYDVSIAAIVQSTPGMVVSDYYEYNGGYAAVSTLVTGKGYWVKCSQPGTLTLPQGGPPKEEPLFTPEEEWLTVTVSDATGNSQQLYLADATGNFELPPLPPNEIFDARFGDDRYISSEATANQLKFQSEDYPLTISVTGGNLKLTDGATGTIINRQLLDGESMTITNKNIGNLNINTVEIPADYVLYQNYPNPFNPATTIKFGLPQAGKVDIIVYNQLGQKVETLISEEMEAGYHEFEWNAMQYSSGVYFYTINSGNFKSVKKMLLLK